MSSKIVIKLGGSSLQNKETLSELALTVRGYRQKGHEVVLVHGGGPAINMELTRRGIEWKFINGQRQTTPQMMKVIESVLAEKVNSVVVESLREAKLSAVGLSGAKDEILFCRQANTELMRVGTVESVETFAIDAVLALDGVPVPVIAPIGYGARGMKYNVNADWAAAKIAAALNAKKLIFLTDQLGILDKNKKLVSQITPAKIQKMIVQEVISGGMCTKVLAMMAAINAGVEQVQVLHASMSSQLLKNPNLGTLLVESSSRTPARAKKEVNHEHKR